jgi:hypothetical protein
VQASYPNSNQELVHVYAATSVFVETVEEFLDLFAREIHACLLHPFAEFCKIQRLAAIVIDVSEKPEDSSKLYKVLTVSDPYRWSLPVVSLITINWSPTHGKSQQRWEITFDVGHIK